MMGETATAMNTQRKNQRRLIMAASHTENVHLSQRCRDVRKTGINNSLRVTIDLQRRQSRRFLFATTKCFIHTWRTFYHSAPVLQALQKQMRKAEDHICNVTCTIYLFKSLLVLRRESQLRWLNKHSTHWLNQTWLLLTANNLPVFSPLCEKQSWPLNKQVLQISQLGQSI